MNKFYIFILREGFVALRRLNDLYIEYCMLRESDVKCLKKAKKHKIVIPVEFRDFIKHLNVHNMDDMRADFLIFLMLRHKNLLTSFDMRICYLIAKTSSVKELSVK